MTRATLIFALASLFASSGLVAGDVIHLDNGRTLEGKVVGRTPTTIRLRVMGGQLELPRKRVRRIEARREASEDYAERAAKTDMEDPREVRALADWASARNLGAQARQLRDLERGLKLERRIARAKAGNKASAYYDTYAWAKIQGFSAETQRYLLQELLERWPDHRDAQRALEAVEIALRPKPAPPTPEELERQALAEKLAQQKAETEALARKLEELKEAKRKAEEEARRRTRIRRRRGRLARRRQGKTYLRPLFTLNPPRERCE